MEVMSVESMIKGGDMEALRAWIAGGGAIDRPINTKTKFAPLHVAVLEGRSEICQLLIDHGADVDRRTAGGMRAIDYAVMMSKPRREIARILIKAGADLQPRCAGGTPIYFTAAGHGWDEICSLLVARCEQIDAKNERGETPLHAVVRGGSIALCNSLLKAGANPNALTMSMHTPLHYAIGRVCSDEMIRALVHGGASSSFAPEKIVNGFARSSNYLTPFQMAVRSSDFQKARLFLSEFGEDPAQKTFAELSMEELAGDSERMRLLLRTFAVEHSISTNINAARAAVDWGSDNVLSMGRGAGMAI
jgi:ankyrin repeat protein